MADEEQKPYNIKLVIGGVIALLLMVGLSSYATSYFVSKSIANPTPVVNPEAIATAGPKVEMGEYTTNLAGNDGANFIKIQIIFEVSNEAAIKEVESKAPMIKHLINSVLRSKSKEELNEKDGMDKLAELLKKTINQKLTEGRVINIYFPIFVIS